MPTYLPTHVQDVRGPAVDAAVKESQRLMTLLQKSAFAWKHKAHAQHQVCAQWHWPVATVV